MARRTVVVGAGTPTATSWSSRRRGRPGLADPDGVKVIGMLPRVNSYREQIRYPPA